MRIASVTVLMTIAFVAAVPGEGAEDEWTKDVEAMLTALLACKEPVDDISPCNRFAAQALKRVYGITDFDRPGKPGEFLSANEIATFVALNSDRWTSLGMATDQSALDEAQGNANLKKAVIAIAEGAPNGHVALVLPGNQTPSVTWHLKVPNSASFFLKKPKQSYVSKPLSFAFQTPAGVKIYGRNF